MLKIRALMLVCLCSAVNLAAQVEMARLRPQPAWQRTSPNPKALDGPVLYQIIIRSSATPGHLPKISNSFTLTNSFLSEDATAVHLGGMSINGASGIITFANGQTFPGGGAGTVTSVTAGTGLTATPSPITASGTIALDTAFTDSRYAAASSLASYLLLSGGSMSGPLQLNGAPTAPLQAATKGYADALFQAVPKDSIGVLAADYEFDETMGTVFADSSGFNRNATSLIGGIAPGVAGHTGKAISFSGGVLSATGVPDSAQVWVEAWISYNPPSTGTILTKPGEYALQLQSGSIVFAVTAANGSCSAQSAVLPANTFVHVGGWYNGLSMVVETNGKTTEVPCTMGPLTSANSLFIGASDGTGANSFSGIIDELRLRTVAPPPQQLPPTNQYCGATANTAGNLSFSSSTGYRAAALMCQQVCSSSTATMCMAPDMARSAQLGLTLPAFAVWYSSGTSTPGPSSTTLNDCNAWTSAASSFSGPVWATTTPASASCGTMLPVACCMLK